MFPTIPGQYRSGIATKGGGQLPHIDMTVVRYVAIAAILAAGTSIAIAKSFVSEVAGAVAAPAGIALPSAKPPEVTLRKNLDLELHQDGVGTGTFSPNPAKGPPDVEVQTGNKDIDNAFKNINGAVHLPQQAAQAALDAAVNAAKTAVENLLADLQKQFWERYEQLKKQALPYLYVAAAAFIAILMLPGFIGSLFAIWLVRMLDRRSDRRRAKQLKEALTVVKNHATEIENKLAA